MLDGQQQLIEFMQQKNKKPLMYSLSECPCGFTVFACCTEFIHFIQRSWNFFKKTLHVASTPWLKSPLS
eukprot:m.3720 g.3720  ORF g.3720 m.3720 type:complete len:69 (-) comp3717_c0_seq1:500-706(-)